MTNRAHSSCRVCDVSECEPASSPLPGRSISFASTFFQRVGMRRSQAFIFAAFILFLLSNAWNTTSVDAQSPIFQLELRNGSLLVCELETKAIAWNDVALDGAVTPGTRKLSEIRALTFAMETVSQQVARVNQLIDQLSDDDFRSRAQAEARLIEEGGAFIEILEKRQNAGASDSESRYRLARVLKKLVKTSKGQQASYDILSDDQGVESRGDSPNLLLIGNYYGNRVEFGREDLVRISKITSRPKETPSELGGYQPVDQAFPSWVSHILHKVSQGFQKELTPLQSFYDKAENVVDFDIGESNSKIAKNSRIENAYVFRGVKFECEGKDNHFTSDSYGVKGISEGSSAACNDFTFKGENGYSSPKYKGVFRATFCMPGQGNSLSSVKRVGAYVQRIDPPRTIVMEAYNADGERVGICEAFKTVSFVGIESSEPISHVRILTNRELDADDPDVDFAIDDFCFDSPVRQNESANADLISVKTRRGDTLLCQSLTVEGGQISLIGIGISVGDEGGPKKSPFTVGLNEIAAISFASSPNKRKKRETNASAFARLKDGSVVAINKFGDGGIVDFPTREFEIGDICAVWGRDSTCLHPEKQDFKKEMPIVVFPTYRLLANNFKIEDNTAFWTRDGSKIKKQFSQEVDGVRDPDHPGEFDIDQLPSIWLNRPVPQAKGTGMIRLTDGQRFVLGGSEGFQIKDFDQDSVTITFGDDKVVLPVSYVRGIIFPSSERGR